MDQLERPSQRVWENRRRWFEELFDIESKGGAYILGEHALGLLVDLQAVYCCGAFISAVILSCTIIDTHLRETELLRNLMEASNLFSKSTTLTVNLNGFGSGEMSLST